MDTRNISTSSKSYTAVIFDLGDVLFTWSPSTPKSPLPVKVLQSLLCSVHWFEYEKGNLEEAEVYSLVAQEFNVTSADVENAIQAGRHSLQSNPKMFEVIRELKEAGLAIYAMSNISAPDWEMLATKATVEEWALFDHIFTSAAARERKPNIGFFKHVVDKAGIDPRRTIFVDDKLDNVLTAQSFGMHGIVFDEQSKVIKNLKNLCYDPVLRGKKYLASHKGNLNSVTSNGVEFLENFSQLLILGATGDKSLVDYVKYPGQFNFFRNGCLFTKTPFPNDLDTTSIGLIVSDHVDATAKHEIMDEMLKYCNSDGIIQVYFDHSRPRIDPFVCANVLALFYENGRGHELPGTLDWVEQVLINRAYISGTSYYDSADQFLFFLSRLLQNSAGVRQRLWPVFKDRVLERFGAEGDSLSLAARIIAATVVDLVDDRDLKTLLFMQREDGSWGNSWIYRWGKFGVKIGNDGVTTALAIQAIQKVQLLHKMQSNALTKPSPLLSNIFNQLATYYISRVIAVVQLVL